MDISIASDFVGFRIIDTPQTSKTFRTSVRKVLRVFGANDQDIHATNVAIQKISPTYDEEKGSKWPIRNFRHYMNVKHGVDRTDELFNDIEQVMVKSLLAVAKIMVPSRACFELYGYDILIDEDLKP